MSALRKNPEIEVPERGTTAAMEWIRENSCPDLQGAIFYNEGTPFLIVSDIDPAYLESIERSSENTTPFWYTLSGKLDGVKRMTRMSSGGEPSWVFNIDEHYYFATPW